jgi:hypothetical protein
MSISAGIPSKEKSDGTEQQENKTRLSLYGDLLPSSAVIEQEPVKYPHEDKPDILSSCQ